VSVTAKPCYQFGGQISATLIDLVGITARLAGANLRRWLPTPYESFSGECRGSSRLLTMMSLDNGGGRPTGPEPCDHPATEFVGYNRDANFFRCRACGCILISQRGRVWAIRPLRSPTRSAPN